MKHVLAAAVLLIFAHPAFGQDPGTTAMPAMDESSRIEYLPWYVNVGMSAWTMGLYRSEKFSGLSSQAGYRFNRTLGAEFETNFGRAKYETGYYSSTLRQDIYSLALTLTPVSMNMFGWNFLEVGIITGGSYFDQLNDYAGYVSGRVSMALNPSFAMIGQYRKYLGLSDVTGEAYDRGSTEPEDFTTFAVSMRF